MGEFAIIEAAVELSIELRWRVWKFLPLWADLALLNDRSLMWMGECDRARGVVEIM